MNWIDRLLQRIFNFFVITNQVGDPYIFRYKLFRLPFFKVYLHHILRSDEDEELHDHPWGFVSIILWRGYVEVLPGGAHTVRPGSIIRHKATDSHRLILKHPAWTLVFVTGRKRIWGFYAKEGWTSYMDFFDRKYGVGNWTTF